jgi:hypothetical protein
MLLTDEIRVDSNSLEFEVYIKSMGESFNLTSYQCSFLFNTENMGSGRLTFSYVDGTSELTNLPTFAIGINNFDGRPKLTFASLPGLDIITESQMLVGRFRLRSSEMLTIAEPNITWCFNENVSTILTDETFQNVTLPSNHIYNITLGFDSQSAEIPKEHQLLQNFPNPFNPITRITFHLPKKSIVKLTVYNLLGQEIKVLMNDLVDAGIHTTNFDAEELPSGIYFARLNVDNEHLKTIKMIFLK